VDVSARLQAGPARVMKISLMRDGEDPAAIVSFEVEQMIMARLIGVHVPRLVASEGFRCRLPGLRRAFAQVATGRFAAAIRGGGCDWRQDRMANMSSISILSPATSFCGVRGGGSD